MLTESLLSLDTIIFTLFMLANLAVGLFYSRGIKNAGDYAIGGRDFATPTIAATVIATYIGAGILSNSLAESYRQGLYYIIPALCEPLTLVVTAYFFIPRMSSLLGSLSVAEAMGRAYGKSARVISAISGILYCTGCVALQFKVSASIMQLFFGISSFYAIALSAGIIILYSSFGGIKAVTFTDILQFCAFGTILPLICISIWKVMPADITYMFHALSQNPLFDYKEVFDTGNKRLISSVFLFLTLVTPSLGPPFFQRISMSSGVVQAKKSFIISAIIIFGITLLICWTGVLLFLDNPNLDPNHLLSHILNTYTYSGFKGMAAICIMAMIMSTADSYINSATVLLTHDIIEVFNFKQPPQCLSEEVLKSPAEFKTGLLLLRIVAFAISIVALVLAYQTKSLFDLLMKTYSFYLPVVTTPLMLYILGFRIRPRIILTGMAGGALTVVVWPFFVCLNISEGIIGMLVNFTLLIAGYLLVKSTKGKIDE